jgi:Mn-dependent DtxR family transcriptional regulator
MIQEESRPTTSITLSMKCMVRNGWREAHAEADLKGHILSERGKDCLDDNLGNSQTCPNGNPLPWHEELADL